MSARGPRAPSWWRPSPPARSLFEVLRGWSPPAAFAGAGVVLGGCGEVLSRTPDAPEHAALADQQSLGWSVGGEGGALVFPDAQRADVSGGVGWREAMPTLATRLQPGMARWAPYYSPALFQSLEAPRSADLRFEMRPIFTPEMALAERRGQALLSALTVDGVCRNDVAVVLDLAGPEAVAVASALAHCFDPVFVFDNWPHPRGVVPAHLTLASTLYFLPSFERERSARVAARALVAPVFVLDRARAAPYVDAADQFDNRYFASLPPPEDLRAAGIRHVLYVTPNDQVTLESDDLNDDLVALDADGVDVRMLALSDFSEPLADWRSDPNSLSGCAPAVGPPAGGLYFGGTAASQSCFSFWYGWDVPLAGVSRPAPPPRFLARCHFHPQPRAMFAAGAGFHGRAGGWRSGVFGFSRSGSLGRVHSGFSG
jgi:hypothetical protein